MTAASSTHVGYVRRRNEDSYYVGEHLFAVADGLGGHVAGDIASATVIEAIARHDQPAAPSELCLALGRAVYDTTAAMRSRVAAEPELRGMGSTLVALMRSGLNAAVANVGDSRAYLFRAGRLTQITEDHVYGRLVVGADTVPNLPERLARFIDGRPDGRSPELHSLELRQEDRVLLCSDGLSSFVDPAVMVAALTGTTADEAASRLVASALSAGGPDNVTVVVVDA